MEKHFATSGFVTNKDYTKILMVYHKKLNIWVIPGGHLEPNELPEDGAIREVLEETGVEAEILDCSNVSLELAGDKEYSIMGPMMMLSEKIPAHGDKPEHIHMDFIFLCQADDKKPLKKQEDEVNDVKWMTLQEVMESGTFDSVKEIAKAVLL